MTENEIPNLRSQKTKAAGDVDQNNPYPAWGGAARKKARELAALLLQEGYSLAEVRRVGLTMTTLAAKDCPDS